MWNLKTAAQPFIDTSCFLLLLRINIHSCSNLSNNMTNVSINEMYKIQLVIKRDNEGIDTVWIKVA